jgi:voltage-gated potassium channel
VGTDAVVVLAHRRRDASKGTMMDVRTRIDGGLLQDLMATPRLVFARVGPPLLALLALFLTGSVGYWLLGQAHGEHWSLEDCAFMTVITLTTVGYGEVVPLQDAAVRLFTSALLVVGGGISVWSVSAVTAFIVEGHLGLFFREKALEKHIGSLQAHTIICGICPTSEHVMDEHVALKKPFVVVDAVADAVHALRDRRGNIPAVVGDPSTEDVMRRAGLMRAASLVCCLPTDKDNLFLVVTARQLRSDVAIVVECHEQASVPKMRAAGASHVINPAFIGGMRMASQVLRPHAVEFLDHMLRSGGSARVTEVTVPAGLVGRALSSLRIQEQTGVAVVAVRSGTAEFVYAPAADTPINEGMVLIVIAEHDRVERVRAIINAI